MTKTYVIDWKDVTPTATSTTNVKADQGKAGMASLPLAALEIVARVFDHGNARYAEDNWMRRDTATGRRYAAAALRHLTARQKGVMLDPDSGLPHVAHCIASLLIMLHAETQPEGEGLWR